MGTKTHFIEQQISARDRYQIIEKIGSGAMGDVYKAQDIHLKRLVALKVLKSSCFHIDVKRFFREAEALAQLNHPNLIKIYDIVSQTNYHFFTMEYIDGITLKEYISKSEFATDEIIELMIDIAEAIRYTHSCGILHRDLKPANIMIDSNRSPIVMDFGIAKKINDKKSISNHGKILGTIRYMAPEQANGEDVNEQCDIYSLGVIFYELLSGKAIFPDKEGVELLFQIANSTPKPLRKVNTKIDPKLERICMKALSKNPQKRYKSVDEFLHKLQKYSPQNKKNKAPLNIWKVSSFSLTILLFMTLLFSFFKQSSSPPKIGIIISQPKFLNKKRSIRIKNDRFEIYGKVKGKKRIYMVLINNQKVEWNSLNRKFYAQIKIKKDLTLLKLRLLYYDKTWQSKYWKIIKEEEHIPKIHLQGYYKRSYDLMYKLITLYSTQKQEINIGMMTEIIWLTISIGAPIYDRGNPKKCYDVYKNVIKLIAHKCPKHLLTPEVKKLVQVLELCLENSRRYTDYSQKAWGLRYGFDKIISLWIGKFQHVRELIHLSNKYYSARRFFEAHNAIKSAAESAEDLDIYWYNLEKIKSPNFAKRTARQYFESFALSKIKEYDGRYKNIYMTCRLLPFLKARTLFMRRKFEEASKEVQKGILYNQSFVKNPQFFKYLIYIYQEKRYIENLSQKVAIYPNKYSLKFLLGFRYILAGRKSEGREYMKKALIIHPNLKVARIF